MLITIQRPYIADPAVTVPQPNKNSYGPSQEQFGPVPDLDSPVPSQPSLFNNSS